MRTAVLIHGYHLQALEWKNIVWGNPDVGVNGRVPKGLLVAHSEGAEMIIWGTGASERDGVKESRFTFEYAKERLAYALIDGMYWPDIERKSVLDEETQGTTQEVRRAVECCLEHSIERLILVSSPTHIARCLMEALKLTSAGETGNLEIMATASDTCFANTVPSDVVVIEPPHRGDLPHVPFHQTAKGIFGFLKDPKIAFGYNEAWAKLTAEWKTRL